MKIWLSDPISDLAMFGFYAIAAGLAWAWIHYGMQLLERITP
jgi:hypothetical protein